MRKEALDMERIRSSAGKRDTSKMRNTSVHESPRRNGPSTPSASRKQYNGPASILKSGGGTAKRRPKTAHRTSV